MQKRFPSHISRRLIAEGLFRQVSEGVARLAAGGGHGFDSQRIGFGAGTRKNGVFVFDGGLFFLGLFFGGWLVVCCGGRGVIYCPCGGIEAA